MKEKIVRAYPHSRINQPKKIATCNPNKQDIHLLLKHKDLTQLLQQETKRMNNKFLIFCYALIIKNHLICFVSKPKKSFAQYA